LQCVGAALADEELLAWTSPLEELFAAQLRGEAHA